MILAHHFHDEIVRQAIISPLLVLAALVALFFFWGLEGRGRLPLLVVAVAIVVFGLYRTVEVPALQHNHLCHAHNFNPCSGGNAHDEDGHTHWFGGRAARPQ
jgi:hypothetical protein